VHTVSQSPEPPRQAVFRSNICIG